MHADGPTSPRPRWCVQVSHDWVYDFVVHEYTVLWSVRGRAVAYEFFSACIVHVILRTIFRLLRKAGFAANPLCIQLSDGSFAEASGAVVRLALASPRSLAEHFMDPLGTQQVSRDVHTALSAVRTKYSFTA